MTHCLTPRAVILAALACAVSAMTAPAFAQSDDAAPSITVQLTDINLDSPKGAKVALARITRAAEVVCGDRPRVNDLTRFRPFLECQNTALNNAVSKVNSPLLSQLAPNARPPATYLAAQ